MAPVEVSGDRQAGLSSGGANEVQDLLITVEWFAGRLSVSTCFCVYPKAERSDQWILCICTGSRICTVSRMCSAGLTSGLRGHYVDTVRRSAALRDLSGAAEA